MAAGVNTLSVAWQQEREWLTRRFGSRAWYVHLAIITPIWGLFLLLQGRLGSQVHWPLAPELKPAGVALGTLGVALLLGTSWQLGLTRTFNGYFFGRGRQEPVSGGVFRWLRNPIYDSFLVLFVAEAFGLGNAVYLILAAESFLLLNQLEARVENRPFRADPRTGPAPRAGL
jgi:protein-S-isoprenylcysteine O-methyltransferase Ste14